MKKKIKRERGKMTLSKIGKCHLKLPAWEGECMWNKQNYNEKNERSINQYILNMLNIRV